MTHLRSTTRLAGLPWTHRPKSVAPWNLPGHTFSFLQRRPTIRPHGSGALGDEPTIYALSTAPGRAAIAVIRISGPACVDIYHSICRSKHLPKPRQAVLRTLFDPTAPSPPSRSAVLDSALVLFFRGPHSVTGEDVLELHVHGGPAIVRAVLASIPKCTPAPSPALDRLVHISSVRYAEPGEFTRRAYLNSRLSLPQVEALGHALAAATEQQRQLSTTGARLAARYECWARALLLARAELEALIDFGEDQHLDESPDELAVSVATQVRELRRAIDAHAANAARGELLRSGIGVALLGEPNAGKSSLLNAVVGREAAIVSQERGTTRDVVETTVDLGGWLCRVSDTAGLRAMSSAADKVGAVETEGMARAREKAATADVVVCVFPVEPSGLTLSAEVVATARECINRGRQVMAVVNKMDLLPHCVGGRDEQHERHLSTICAQLDLPLERICFISCKEATAAAAAAGITTISSPSGSTADPGNMQSFLTGLISVFRQLTSPVVPDLNDAAVADTSMWQESLGATERQRLLLEECSAHLEQFLAEAEADEKDSDAGLDVALAAEELRAAATCLAKITGRGEGAGNVEEVLGVVFEKFCVGK